MTVSEFAVAMYGCEVIKDTVRIMKNGELLYADRMEFLRYAHEDNPEKMWFAGETITTVMMIAEGNTKSDVLNPEYSTVIII